VLVDAQVRVVDAGVVVLGPVEDDGGSLEGVGVVRVFMTPLSNRFPVMTWKPAASTRGSPMSRMTSRSVTVVSRQLSPIVRPLTVSASSWMRPCFMSSLTTAGTPPARKNSSPRKRPAGCMSTSSGTSCPCSCQSSRSSSTPR
jgi:hypothetical protein